MLKPLLLLPAVVLFSLGAASSPSFAPQEGTGKPSKPAAGPSARVKELYKMDCGICHNDNGDGKAELAKSMNLTLSDLTDPKTLEGKTDEQLFNLIRKGNDKMPGEDAARAKDAEIKGIIEYIRGFSKNAPTPASTPAPAAASSPTTPGSN